eukprot:TRINITY_DN4583_c0_g1_i6.p1 TRINITY_DN4583_c0_g1~~TRINITY_DN4583_c0_g1_i6.p1  ORF type:complete len:236 (+),score=9.61 TRINITY_DN4583_c0_g1_i6:25-708(+)
MTSLRALVYAVCWGANDSALSHSSQHVPLSEYQSNLDLIVRTLQATQPEGDDPHRAPFVLLLTPPPVIETRWEVELRGKVPPRKLDRCLEVWTDGQTDRQTGGRKGLTIGYNRLDYAAICRDCHDGGGSSRCFHYQCVRSLHVPVILGGFALGRTSSLNPWQSARIGSCSGCNEGIWSKRTSGRQAKEGDGAFVLLLRLHQMQRLIFPTGLKLFRLIRTKSHIARLG